VKRAVITGADGQDGSYLAELLISKRYEVHALVRPGTHPLKNLTPDTITHPDFHIIKGDINSIDTTNRLIDIKPDEFYHLAALSHVGDSFNHPMLTHQTNFLSTQRLLDRLKDTSTKFYFAGSSETLAEACKDGQNADHTSPFSAYSPYAVSKMASQELVKIYRKAYSMFAVSGISFNHESRRRGPNFVTRKLALGVRNYIETGVPVEMGNPTAKRDWHHAKDTMRGAWLSLQHFAAQDYTFCSGTSHSVMDFARAVCDLYDVEEVDDAIEWKKVEKRPWDVECLRGNNFEAEVVLGWEREYDFQALVKDVCECPK